MKGDNLDDGMIWKQSADNEKEKSLGHPNVLQLICRLAVTVYAADGASNSSFIFL